MLTNARALQDQWRAQRATADNDEFPGLEVPGFEVAWRQRLRWASPNSSALVSLDEDLLTLGVYNKMQVLVVLTCAMDVGVRRV